jgi:hypothetical protein
MFTHLRCCLTIDTSPWVKLRPTIAKQVEDDCGVFTCMMIDDLSSCLRPRIDFGAEDMVFFLQKMALVMPSATSTAA